YAESHPGAEYTPRWQDTGFWNLKYIAREGGNHGYIASDNLNYGNNERIYRYAETLLNAAELSLLLGQDGSSYLKQVRDRANCHDTGTSREDIIQERHKEFVGEGKRYWDLVRSGQAAFVLTAANHEYRTVNWTDNKKYWPIPQSEIDKDPALQQNNY
ncbi:MAG: RagB/SusD family nutrient uptake outer membrane protein, partial [Bacteroidales bacterium]|nr:RagB/SusD family nutrient uptake outer membrane protein [Bacteroidales bacterium]